MPDRGYGSPSSFTLPTNATSFDRGYGSPSTFTLPTAQGFDEGYGSPFIIVTPVVIGLHPPGNGPNYPDDGGVVMELRGNWPERGPYRVRLIDADGGEHPPTGGCYGGVPGAGDEILTNEAQDRLRFVLPALALGAYSVEIRWGVGYGQVATATPGLRVVRRNRALATYGIRARYPLVFRVGPRAVDRERLLEP